jgi:hypothetical protein
MARKTAKCGTLLIGMSWQKQAFFRPRTDYLVPKVPYGVDTRHVIQAFLISHIVIKPHIFIYRGLEQTDFSSSRIPTISIPQLWLDSQQ